jgi:8-hydroxy-5-deazaflavin:NADPH oxidoreductase
MATLGIIGAGAIGTKLAQQATAAGIDVVLANSRGPETLAATVARLGARARAATPEAAARAGDWVVVSIPLAAYQQLPAAELAGKVVLDTDNYYPQRDGNFAELDEGKRTSAELEQEHLGSAHVVKVFNNIFFKHLGSLARPAGSTDRSALPIAADDAAALRTAAEFLDRIGYDSVEAGTLADSWRFEPGQPAYGPPYGSFEDPIGTPASAQKVRAAIEAATR